MGLTTYLVGDGADDLPGWRDGLTTYLVGDGADDVPGWRWG